MITQISYPFFYTLFYTLDIITYYLTYFSVKIIIDGE